MALIKTHLDFSAYACGQSTLFRTEVELRGEKPIIVNCINYVSGQLRQARLMRGSGTFYYKMRRPFTSKTKN